MGLGLKSTRQGSWPMARNLNTYPKAQEMNGPQYRDALNELEGLVEGPDQAKVQFHKNAMNMILYCNRLAKIEKVTEAALDNWIDVQSYRKTWASFVEATSKELSASQDLHPFLSRISSIGEDYDVAFGTNVAECRWIVSCFPPLPPCPFPFSRIPSHAPFSPSLLLSTRLCSHPPGITSACPNPHPGWEFQLKSVGVGAMFGHFLSHMSQLHSPSPSLSPLPHLHPILYPRPTLPFPYPIRPIPPGFLSCPFPSASGVSLPFLGPFRVSRAPSYLITHNLYPYRPSQVEGLVRVGERTGMGR